MTLLHAIILGIVQGLGEFLPISSSAHLVILPWFFNFPDPGLSFDVALHLGTLLAVVFYFRRDFFEIISSAFFIKNYKLKAKSYTPSLLWLIVIATIPGAFFGYFLESYAETVFRSPLLVAAMLSVAGLVLFLADQYARHSRDINEIKTKDAILIGLSQALAIIPGVSRAGATITAGLFLGLSRASAARFSFLLSAPIIFGATIIKLPEFISHGIDLQETIAILISAVSGYFAIAFLLKFIERTSYKIFFWYRLALAALIVIFWIFR